MSIAKFKHYPATSSFNNLVHDFFPQFPSLFRDELANNLGHSIPVNIAQKEDGYKLEIVAPGFTKEDFKVTLEKNLLTIEVTKKAEEENKNEKSIRKEYKYQSFKRSFTLNEKIDTEKIAAKYKNGVLTLNLWNKEEVKAPTKQITIQ